MLPWLLCSVWVPATSTLRIDSLSLCCIIGTEHCVIKPCHYFQIAAGFPDPSFSSFSQLAYVLKGVRRSSSSPCRHRLPVTPAMLEVILAAWSRAPFTFDQTMLWAAFCLAFFAFLHTGEFTCLSMQSFDPSSMLSADDIGIDSHSNPKHMTVRLKRSKCDPFGAGIM